VDKKMDWAAFGTIINNLTAYLFGSYVATSLILTIMFVILLSINGINIKYSILLSLPIIATFNLAGLLGSYSWIVNLFLLFVAIIYGYSLVKIMS